MSWNLKEHGYKPKFDGYGIDLPWWKTLLAFIVFTPVCLIVAIRDMWRYRK